MKSVFVLVLLTVCAVQAQLLRNDPLYCYTTDPFKVQNKRYGTMTPYDQVRGSALTFLPVTNCKPDKFWFQGRHGSRYPSVPDTDNLFNVTDHINKQIVDNYVSMKTTLCPSDARELNNWVLDPNFNLMTPGLLTETGRVELKAMGQRFRKAFPKLLPAVYDPSHYYFRRSPITRTLQSAQAFASGVFGDQYATQINYDGGTYPEPYFLPFYFCPDFIKLALAPIPQQLAFLETPVYKQMLAQVNKKLGFTGANKLTADQIDKMITHCKYEQMNNHVKPSAFCAAFSVANHQVSQYSYDLLNYFRSGYGFTSYKYLFENMSCTLIQAMLKFLQSNAHNEPVAKLWFGHDVTLQLVFVSLGLYKDDVPLRANNFANQTERKWKAGQLTPMAGNMAVIRYNCPSGDDEVLFLHNERPLQIPGCQPNGMCKLTFILQKYERFLYAQCDAVQCLNTKLI